MAADDLDYGPAPGDPGMPRVGNIKDWARAHTPGYQAPPQGANPFNPDNKPLSIDVKDAYKDPATYQSPLIQPGIKSEAPGQAGAAEVPPTEAPPPEDILSQQTLKRGTAKDMLRYLVEERGIPFGTAAGYMYDWYQQGDPIVANLAGMDALAAKIPGRIHRFATQTGLAAAELPMKGVEKLGQLGESLGIPGASTLTDVGQQVGEEIATRRESYVPPFLGDTTKAKIGNLLPDLVGSTPAWIAASAVAEGAVAGLLPRLPFIAKTLKAGDAVKAAVLSDRLGTVANYAGQIGAAAGIAGLEGSDVKTNVGMVAGQILVGRALSKLGGKVWGLFRPKDLGPVTDWLAKEYGVTATEMAPSMNNTAAVLDDLLTRNAPPQILSTFFRATHPATWEGDAGKVLGGMLAHKDATTEELERVLSLVPERGHATVKKSYLDYLAQWAKPAIPEAGSPEAIVGPTNINPLRVPKVETFPVLHEPVSEVNGAREYRDPQNRLGQPETYIPSVREALADKRVKNGTQLVLRDGSTVQLNHIQPGIQPDGTVMTMEGTYVPATEIQDIVTKKGVSLLSERPSVPRPKAFVNPITVNYNPAKETAAEAVIKEIARPSMLGKQALSFLGRTAFKTTAEYNQAAKEIAYTIARQSGYDSIFAKGHGPNDHIFVDLLGFQGKGGLSEATQRIQAQVEKASRSYLEQFPVALLALGGAGALLAYDAMAPNESNAMSFNPLKRLFTKAILGGEKMAEGFTEVVSPEGKLLRPPEAYDFRSPLFDPSQNIAHGHGDIPVLDAADKADLLSSGYLRTFRQNNLIGLQFNPESGSTQLASDWLKKNWKHGDEIVVDKGSEGYRFFLPGEAASFIKGKLGRLALIAAVTGGLSQLVSPDEADAAEVPWGKFAGQGFKGLAEELVTNLSQSKTPAELAAILAHSTKQAADDVPNKFATVGEALLAAGDTAPNKVFGGLAKYLPFGKPDPNTELLANAPYMLTLPTHAIEHPVANYLLGLFVTKKSKMLTGSNSATAQLKKEVDEAFAGLGIEHFDNIEAAYEGLKQNTRTGEWTQSLLGIPEAINKAALKVREVDDIAFKMRSGIDSQAKSIIDELGLPENEDTWRKLKYIQSIDPSEQGGAIWKGKVIDNTDIQAADRTMGMINPNEWHNLDTQFITKGLTRYPIRGEQMALLEHARNLSSMSPNGMSDADQAALKVITDRIAFLEQQTQKLAQRRTANELLLPGRKWGPRREAAVAGIPDVTKLKDSAQVMHKYIDQIYSQAFFAEQAHSFRAVTTWLDNAPVPGFELGNQKHAADFLRRFYNVQSGLRGLNEDSYWASRLNRVFPGHAFDVQTVRNLTGIATQLQYISKLAINPAYALVNTTQPFMTTLGVVKGKNFLSGFGKALAAPAALLREVGEANLLKTESHILEEVGNPIFKKTTDVLDLGPKISENWNRIVAYSAGKAEALDRLARGKLNKASDVPFLFRAVMDHSAFDKGPEEIVKAYAAAVVRATQFMPGPEGRPLMWSGGMARRITGQFKSFQASYFNMLRQTLGRTIRGKGSKEELLMGVKLVGLLAAFGGVNAVVGDTAWRSILDVLRRGAIAAGIDPDWIPDQTPIGKLFSLVGMDSFIDISGSVAPLNFPNPLVDPGKFVLNAAGPTVGNAVGAAGELWKFGMLGSQSAADTASNIGRQGFPSLVAGLEALQEAGLTPKFLDEWGYRGGMYSKGGKPLVQGRDASDIIRRGLNLTPSPARQRAEYIQEIQNQFLLDRPEKAREVLDEARAKGFIIDKAALGNIKRKLKEKLNLTKPNQPIGQ